PHAIGRHPGTSRAGHGRDQLRLPVQAHRQDRLSRLDRLRVPPGGGHGGRSRLGEGVSLSSERQLLLPQRTRKNAEEIDASVLLYCDMASSFPCDSSSWQELFFVSSCLGGERGLIHES